MAAKQHLRKSKTRRADNPHGFRQNMSAVALPQQKQALHSVADAKFRARVRQPRGRRKERWQASLPSKQHKLITVIVSDRTCQRWPCRA